MLTKRFWLPLLLPLALMAVQPGDGFTRRIHSYQANATATYPTPVGKLRFVHSDGGDDARHCVLYLDGRELLAGHDVTVYGYGTYKGATLVVACYGEDQGAASHPEYLHILRISGGRVERFPIDPEKLDEKFDFVTMKMEVKDGLFRISSPTGTTISFDGTALEQTVKVKPRDFSRPLDLRTFPGKNPHDLKAWTDPRFKALFYENGFSEEQVAGAEYRLSVCGPFKRSGGFLFLSGLAPHLGGVEFASLAIHPGTRKVHYIGVAHGKDITCLGFSRIEDLCPAMLQALDDAYLAHHEATKAFPTGPFNVTPVLKNAYRLKLKEEARARAAAKAAPGPRPLRGKLPRDQFRQAVLGRSMQEVLALLGRPERTNQMSHTFWTYRHRTFDPVTGRLDWSASIQFTGSYADRVDFMN
ncbi:MAG TPA: hypothetical protein VK188_04795 [Holophaga sp.]|nr:hypothetical protein [Holophaga sp.]